jgi:hypothetical protein
VKHKKHTSTSTDPVMDTGALAVTGQSQPESGPVPNWVPLQPGRWCSSDGRYVLIDVTPPGLLSRLQSMITGGRRPAQTPSGTPGFLPEVVAASRWSQPVEWTPAKADVGAAGTWLGLDSAGRDVVLATSSRTHTGQVRVHHGLVVGQTGKSMTLQALLLPGLAAGTELVLVADGQGDSLDDLKPYLTRLARRHPQGLLRMASRHPQGQGQRWEQVIALAWQIMRSRQDRGWDGPSRTDPVITLVVAGASTVKDGLDYEAQAAFVEISRDGERLGIRTIQTVTGPATTNLIGGNAWRATTRWTIGHAVTSAFDDRLATQSTNEDVSLLGLPVGHAAVIDAGRVLTPDAAIAMATPTRIDEAMAGVSPAQLHPHDLAAAGQLWSDTAAWSTGQEAGTDA